MDIHYIVIPWIYVALFMKVEAQPDLCQMPIDSGDCTGSDIKWAYNSYHQRCEQFIYHGCNGNWNRFNSEYDCLMRCNPALVSTTTTMSTTTKTTTSPKGIQCPWHCATASPVDCCDTCERYYDSCGCSYCNPRRTTTPSIVPTCGVICHYFTCAYPEVWVPDNCCGHCEQVSTSYTTTSVYGGEETTTSCTYYCSSEPCVYPNQWVPALCGCGYCKTTSGEIIRPQYYPLVPEECRLVSDSGSKCTIWTESVTRYAYDNVISRCLPFRYNGCEGNDNNFLSETSCLQSCHHFTAAPIPIHDIFTTQSTTYTFWWNINPTSSPLWDRRTTPTTPPRVPGCSDRRGNQVNVGYWYEPYSACETCLCDQWGPISCNQKKCAPLICQHGQQLVIADNNICCSLKCVTIQQQTGLHHLTHLGTGLIILGVAILVAVIVASIACMLYLRSKRHGPDVDNRMVYRAEPAVTGTQHGGSASALNHPPAYTSVGDLNTGSEKKDLLKV